MKTFEFDENDIVVDTTCISDTPDDILYFDIDHWPQRKQI